MIASGIIYTEERKKRQDRYVGAVERAHFLNAEEKKHWVLLSSLLTTKQLKEAELLIIDEDLKRLAMQEQLEKLKPVSGTRWS